MPNKRSSKTQDISQIAAEILEEAVGEPAPMTPVGKRNPAAANARRAGVPKGGAAKAKVKLKAKVKTKSKTKVKAVSLKRRKT